jgi:hypothetical protein
LRYDDESWTTRNGGCRCVHSCTANARLGCGPTRRGGGAPPPPPPPRDGADRQLVMERLPWPAPKECCGLTDTQGNESRP